MPFTIPTLSGVSVYMHPGPASWNPVTNVEAPVVPMSPLITVSVPALVIPAPPPIDPKVEAVPRFGPVAPMVVVVVKNHGFGAVPDTSGFPARSVAAGEIVAVY